MKAVALGLRGLELLWTVLILALVGNMIADAKAGDPSIINYSIFLAVFSMLSLIYLIAGTINENFAINPVFLVGVDAINTLLFFCGGVALAADLDVHSCGDKGYVKSNGITNGSDNPSKRCHEAQAVCAFLWFAFAAYAGSFIISLFTMKGTSVPRPSVIRRGGPSMSQV